MEAMSLTSVPKIDEVAAHPELAQSLSVDAARKLHMQCLCALNALSLPLMMNGHAAPQKVHEQILSPPQEPWLSTDEVCARFGNSFSKRWLYDHQKQLGGKRLSRKKLIFDPRKIENFLKRA